MVSVKIKRLPSENRVKMKISLRLQSLLCDTSRHVSVRLHQGTETRGSQKVSVYSAVKTFSKDEQRDGNYLWTSIFLLEDTSGVQLV